MAREKEAMVTYRILMPVTSEADAFNNAITRIPDKTKLTVVNNWDNTEVAKTCKYLENCGAEVLWHPENLGCAPSFNVGVKMLAQPEIDFVIIMVAACLFHRSVDDFVRIIEEREAKEKNYYYLTIGPYHTDLHAFAVTKRFYQEIGTYDENFWPVYYEDTDLGRRMQLMGIQKTVIRDDIRTSQGLSMAVSGDSRLRQLWGINADRVVNYYRSKWGGDHTFETFTHPFNNPNTGINDWVLQR
ncbi:MAG: hypothetical protein WC822_04540 [Candidatus Paceibacterota bacterium]|jgi:GT2 family glycosyltransferase